MCFLPNTTQSFSGYSKCLILGGYLVLNPNNQSLCVSLKPKIETTITIFENSTFNFKILSLPSNLNFEFNELNIFEITKNCFERFIISSLYIFFEYFQIKIFPKLNIIIKGDKEFYNQNGKTGLGSSAATTVSIIGCLLKFQNEFNEELLFKLSSIAHTIAQGNVGSCFDISCSIWGNQIYKRPFKELISLNYINEKWNNEHFSIQIPNSIFIYLILTPFKGTSTPGMINLFEKLYEFDEEIINELKFFIDLSINSFLQNNLNEIKKNFKNVQNILRKITLKWNIPIIPNEIQNIIEDLEKNDDIISVIVPGAGGYDSLAILSNNNNLKLNYEILCKNN